MGRMAGMLFTIEAGTFGLLMSFVPKPNTAGLRAFLPLSHKYLAPLFAVDYICFGVFEILDKNSTFGDVRGHQGSRFF